MMISRILKSVPLRVSLNELLSRYRIYNAAAFTTSSSHVEHENDNKKLVSNMNEQCKIVNGSLERGYNKPDDNPCEQQYNESNDKKSTIKTNKSTNTTYENQGTNTNVINKNTVFKQPSKPYSTKSIRAIEYIIDKYTCNRNSNNNNNVNNFSKLKLINTNNFKYIHTNNISDNNKIDSQFNSKGNYTNTQPPNDKNNKNNTKISVNDKNPQILKTLKESNSKITKDKEKAIGSYDFEKDRYTGLQNSTQYIKSKNKDTINKNIPIENIRFQDDKSEKVPNTSSNRNYHTIKNTYHKSRDDYNDRFSRNRYDINRNERNDNNNKLTNNIVPLDRLNIYTQDHQHHHPDTIEDFKLRMNEDGGPWVELDCRKPSYLPEQDAMYCSRKERKNMLKVDNENARHGPKPGREYGTNYKHPRGNDSGNNNRMMNRQQSYNNKKFEYQQRSYNRYNEEYDDNDYDDIDVYDDYEYYNDNNNNNNNNSQRNHRNKKGPFDDNRNYYHTSNIRYIKSNNSNNNSIINLSLPQLLKRFSRYRQYSTDKPLSQLVESLDNHDLKYYPYKSSSYIESLQLSKTQRNFISSNKDDKEIVDPIESKDSRGYGSDTLPIYHSDKDLNTVKDDTMKNAKDWGIPKNKISKQDFSYETRKKDNNKNESNRRSFSTSSNNKHINKTSGNNMAYKDASRQDVHMKNETKSRNELGESGPDGTVDSYLKNKNLVSNKIWDNNNLKWDPDEKLQKNSSIVDVEADPKSNKN